MASPARHNFPRRVLVTGGCGFIGSALVRHLVKDVGADVLNLDKLTYAGDPSTVVSVASNPGYSLARVDICDGPAVTEAFAGFEPDTVVHLAAESHVDRSIDRPSDFIHTNLVGTFSMLESALRYWQSLEGEARKRFRFLHVSTDEVYGSLPLESPARFEASSPHAPNSPYAASKAGADHLARAWFQTYGLPVMISNCSNNYGPYQFPEKMIPTMVIAGIEGRAMPVYGKGLNVRDWLHVDDHVRALMEIIAKGEPGRCYLIGGGAERSNIDLVRTLCSLLDELLPEAASRPHDHLIRFVSDRPGHDLRYSVNDGPTRAAVGWAPRETLDSGLRKTVAWFRDNQTWWRQIRESRHTGGRLGLARQQAAQ